MNIKDIVDELKDSSFYHNFMGLYPSAFLSAGFFIVDLASRTKSIQLDFFIPEKGRIAAFEFPFKEPKIFDDAIDMMTPLNLELKVDIDDVAKVCDEVIHEHNASLKISKIIAILKSDEWNLTCMDDMMSMVRIRLDAKTGKVNAYTKGSIMDMAKFVKK